MKSADVFLLPAVREGLGTPVLEALACGVPVVSNDIPGVFDQWVKDGVNGYVCRLDARLWAEKIMAACRIDRELLRQSSKDILAVASTETIDKEYLRRLKGLKGSALRAAHK